MWKKVTQALGGNPEDSESENPGIEATDRMNIEIVSVKGTTESICHLLSWITISYQMNGKSEIIQTKRLKPHENSYYDNNNWWIFTGMDHHYFFLISSSSSTEQLSIPREGQITVEVFSLNNRIT